MLRIFQADTDEHKEHARELFWEYLQWGNVMVGREFGISLDVKAMLEQDMAELNKFLPPTGRLLLALQDKQYAGIGCLRKIGEDIGEIKRMYVRPSYRGTGVGRAILQSLVEQARQIGYTRIRLDSALFMKEAHAMYRSAGFTPIEPYAESEIPPEFRRNWIFMELYL